MLRAGIVLYGFQGGRFGVVASVELGLVGLSHMASAIRLCLIKSSFTFIAIKSLNLEEVV